MQHLEDFAITLTKDTNKFAICALMMAATDPWITLAMKADQCRKAFDGPCKEVYLLEVNNNVAGFVILQTAGTFKGYIQTICISELYRGKGLGKKLLQFCEEKILKISPNIFICVSSFNKDAIRLYESVGFKLIGQLENFVKDGFTELLLRKTVGPIADYHFQPTTPIS